MQLLAIIAIILLGPGRVAAQSDAAQAGARTGEWVCVGSRAWRAGTPLARRFVSAGEPCGDGESRLRVVLLTASPFATDPPGLASPASASALERAVIVPASTGLIIETTVVFDNHGPLLAAPAYAGAGVFPVQCSTLVDGQPAGGVLDATLVAAAPGGRTPVGLVERIDRPTDFPLPGSYPDVIRSSLQVYRRFPAGAHVFEVVCSTGSATRLSGRASLAVLQFEW